jgi:hypothetical protein
MLQNPLDTAVERLPRDSGYNASAERVSAA